MTVLQALAVLDALGWPEWDARDPATTHAKVEAPGRVERPTRALG
ncbi:hypothetical protein [Gemmata massiliana]|nr:hypothetical protein [Gemmata massiliana]